MNRIVYICILLVGLIHSKSFYAQDVIPTKGTEFWVGFMQNFQPNTLESLDLFITSSENTTGTVSIPLQDWSIDFNVVANVTTTVSVPNDLAEHFQENQIISDKGILVETQDTVSVFAINFDPFTSDGTKILPTKALGTEYCVSSYTGLAGLGSELLIVATEDDTQVEITPTVNTAGGNPAGVPFTVDLDRGQSYQIQQQGANDDLTGTKIVATESSGPCRPFAVYSGVSCTNIPVGCTFCDHIYEQNFPSNTWGTEYYAVPYEFASGFTYRVLAIENGTNVTIDGGTTISLNAGEFYEQNQVNSATCVQSDSPISVTQYMQGTSCSGTGDPAMLILNDASQKIDNVTFSTVVSNQITSHGINVILSTSDVGTFTVDGTIIDPSQFTQFPACPQSSYAQLSISEGSHTLDAPNGFTAYAFGLGEAESYSYSVGSFSPNPFGDIVIEEAICSDDQVVLAAADLGFGTYWYNFDFPEDTLGLGQSLVIDPPIISGIYVATYNTLLSGCEQTEFFSVEVPDPPLLNGLTEDQTICQYESVQLNVDPSPANSFYQYSWTPTLGLDNPNIANPIATPLNTTTYSVLVMSPTGCSEASTEVTITVEGGDYSNLAVSASDYEICTGESTILSAQINEVFFEDDFDPQLNTDLWSIINNGSESVDCGSITGNALYFNGAGERSVTTVPLDVSTGGAISFALQYGESTFPCDDVDSGEDVILEYSTGGAWNSIQTYFSFNQSGWEQYNVEIPVAAQSASTQFRWRQLANSGANEDNWTLDNIAISFTSVSGLSFDWFDGNGVIATDDDSPEVFPLENTMYFVEAIDPNNGCSYTDSLFISVGQNFTIDISPDTVLCDIQGLELQAIPSTDDQFTYLWSPDDETISSVFSDSPTVSPASTTTYSVEISSDQGCVNTADVTISVNQLLDLTVTASDTEICLGETTELNALISGNPEGILFEWTPSEDLNDGNVANPLATPSESSTYEVLATDSVTGCALSDEITIDVSGAFSIDAGEDQTVCDAVDLELTAAPSVISNYQWSWEPAAEVTISDSPTTNVVNNITNEFVVSATEDGCVQTDTVQVTVIFENFDLGQDIEICEGDTVEFSTGIPDAEHLWSTDETSESISAFEEQEYSVTVTSELGCSLSDEVFLTVNPLPVVDLGGDADLCVGEILDLDAENAGSDFVWSTMENTQVINVSSSDTYSVVVTDDNGCVNDNEINVVFHENPIQNLQPDTTICEDTFITFDAGNTGSTYAWSPNAEDSQTITTNAEGVYSVVVTNVAGCSTEDEVILTIAEYPSLDLGDNISACEGETKTLDSEALAGLNIMWNTGSTEQAISVSNTGTYSVVVDNEYCFANDEVSVVFSSMPVNNLLEETHVCFIEETGPLLLDAGNPGSSYIWNNGNQNALLPVAEAGEFSVLVTTPFGCDSVFNTEVIEFCIGEYIYVPNSFTPNNDGRNEGWRIEGSFIQDFHIQIYNRWGEVIFESEDMNEYWLGNDERGDYYVQSGIYSYKVRFKYFINEFGIVSNWTEKVGTINVIR